MSAFRQAELYVQRRIVTALNLVKKEGETAESIAERYLEKCLDHDYPGIMDVVEECEAAYETTRKANKARVDEWRKASPCCGKPVDPDLKRCPECHEAV